MNDSLLRYWWIAAVRGTVAILFGLLTLFLPAITLLWMVLLFATYALISGAAEVVGSMKARFAGEDWWLHLLLGLVSIVAGLIALLHPALSALVLVLLIGANALVTGVLELAVGIRMHKAKRREPLMLVNAAASILFGVLVFLFPYAGAIALLGLIGLYAMFTGVLFLFLAFRLRARLHSTGLTETMQVMEGDRRITADRRMSPSH